MAARCSSTSITSSDIPPGRSPLFTVGHGTLPADAFASLVSAAGIERVVDIRSYPGSRRSPHFGRPAMEEWLPRAGVAYSWEPRLGGRRRPAPDSPNVGLRDEAFRGYADHMASDEFRAGVEALLAAALLSPVAVMCSESVWWRCHRRLLADAVMLVWGTPVRHLFHDGRVADHPPMPIAHRSGAVLIYG